MLNLDRVCELPLAQIPCEFRIQWADGDWMERGARALRRDVFCAEQGLFAGDGAGEARDDTDDIDRLNPTARTLVALSCWGGQPDEIVGTVRIHEAAPHLWWGARLAVRRDWRRHAQIGSGLIRLAVCSAHALGCTEFLAHVQAQNVPLFQRLHWTLLDEVTLHGRLHGLMRADLAEYPACERPLTGYVLARGEG